MTHHPNQCNMEDLDIVEVIRQIDFVDLTILIIKDKTEDHLIKMTLVQVEDLDHMFPITNLGEDHMIQTFPKIEVAFNTIKDQNNQMNKFKMINKKSKE